MKAFPCLTLFVLACMVFGNGCIPSAPPAPEKKPAAASVPPAAPPAPEAVPPQQARNTGAAPKQPGDTSNIQVPLVPEKIQEGAVEMPVVALVPVTEGKGYVLRSKFPVEGLSMEGSLVPEGPGKWVFSGQFKSTIDSFAPGQPTVQVIGSMVPKEGGGLEFQGNAGEVIILFSAPMPPADAPKLAEPKVLPFKLSFDAPDTAAFNIMLMPI